MNTSRENLIAAIVSLGFPSELGVLIARHLGHPKAMDRMTAYLQYTQPADVNLIVDEALAIREEIDRWRETKRSREAENEYNELLWNGLDDGEENGMDNQKSITELQEALANALISLGVPLSVGLPIMLCLETEDEQVELAQFLLDNLERRPSVGEIDAKVREILGAE